MLMVSRQVWARLVVGLLAAAAMALASLAIARNASIETLGLYWFIVSCLSIGVLPLTFGLDLVLQRYVSDYSANQQRQNLHALLVWTLHRLPKQALAFMALAGMVVAVSLWMATWRLWPLADQFRLLLLVLALGWTVALAALMLVQGFLRGVNLLWADVPQQCLFPVLMLAMLLGCHTLGLAMSIRLLLACSGVAAVLTLLAALLWAIRERKLLAPATGAQTHARPEWRRGLGTLFALALAQAALGHTDMLTLGLLRGTAEAGLYSAPVRIVALFGFALVTVQLLAAGSLQALLATGEQARLRQWSQRINWITTLVTLLFVALAWWFAPLLLSLFGDAYATADTLMALRVLLLAQASAAFVLSTSPLLLMVGLQRPVAVIVLTCAGVNLLLNLALVSRFGLLGAAAATATVLALQNVTLVWLAQRSLWSPKPLREI